MGVLIDTLTAKFAAQTPSLSLAAGIRQESGLTYDSNLAFASVEEMDAHTLELLDAYEGTALTTLNGATNPGGIYFPLPEGSLSALMPTFTSEQRAAIAANLTETAAEALQKYVLGELYLKASNRSPDLYLPKAVFYLGDKSLGRPGDADLTLKRVTDALTGLMANVGRGSSKGSFGTTAMTRSATQTSEYRGRDVSPRCWGDPLPDNNPTNFV